MHTTTHGITHNVKAACFLRIILAKVFEPHVLMSLNLVNHVRDANPTCRPKRGLFRKHIVWKAGSGQLQLGQNTVPREIALTKIMKANMKMMRDARPNQLINLLTTCWPMIAAMNATMMK
jgi:hypothetical protein